jgi:hypothetical protein
MAGDTPFSTRSNPAGHCVGLYGKKQGIEPGFPLNESQIEILNGGFRLDVATTPSFEVVKLIHLHGVAVTFASVGSGDAAVKDGTRGDHG